MPLLDPTHPLKRAWDALILFAVVVVAVELPTRLALRYTFPGEAIIDGAVTALFCVDILAQFNTAIVAAGRRVTDRKEIARRYLRTWFAVDALSAIPFGLIFPAGQLARLVRMLRLLHMLRLLRLARIMQEAQRNTSISPGLLRLAFFMFWAGLIAHWIACGWIAMHPDLQMGAETDRIQTYLVALYWCVTTLTTVGYGDITPSTSAPGHMLYTMGVMVIGVAMYGTVIGNIASILSKIDASRSAYLDKMDRINAFMRHHGLNADLQDRIRTYHEFLWETNHGYDQSKVVADLPQSLRLEVAMQINRRIIAKVPLFEDCEPDILHELVLNMQSAVFGPGDLIVREGDQGESMFFINGGSVDVISGGVVVRRLGEGDYFGEIALLTTRPRTADVRAVDYCSMYTLDQKTVDRVVQRYPDFAARMQERVEERMGDLDTGTIAPVTLL